MANSRQSSAAINEAARLDAEATSLLSDFEPSDIDEYISASQAPAVSPGVPLPTSSPPDSLQTMMLAMIERMHLFNAAVTVTEAPVADVQPQDPWVIQAPQRTGRTPRRVQINPPVNAGSQPVHRNTFSSVLLYHFNFHNMRLQKDAYDPVGWDAAEISRFHILHPNQRTAQDPFASEHKAKSQATGSKPYGRAMPTCTKYNKGECSHKNCKYPHVCSYCMYPSHTVQQCNKKRQAKGMTSNIRVQGSANGANATSKP
ncbi:hypothetical protein FPQ18DRAFT_308784 [Pyronema domesticum]|nr:hypothetical protein FPQ18DRAFT_308784 [Pyronema domesticum]